MASIFTKIIRREIPAEILTEDDEHISFLDVRPLTKGHSLVVPKKEIDYYFDLDEKTMASLSVSSKKLARAIKKAIPCNRIGIAVIGLEVPHAHIHLIPMNTEKDVSFSKDRLQLSSAELSDIATRIRKFL